jgi:MFS family permease
MLTRFRLIASAVAVVVGCSLPGFLIPSLAPEIDRDMPLPETTLGLAIAVFWGTAAVASAPVGRLLDRAGADRGVRIAGVLAVVGAVGAAASRSSAVLICFLGLGGLANAFALPGVSALVARGVPASRQGLALAAQQAAPPLASLFAGLAVPLLAQPFGWRSALLVAAPLALLSAAWVPPEGCRGSSRGPHGGAAHARRLALTALGAALANAAAGALLSFLVVFAVERDIGQSAAGLLLAATGLAAALTRLAVGALADRSRRALLVQVAAMMAVGAIGYALLFVGGTAALLVGALIAGGIGWGWTGVLLLAVVEEHRDAPASAIGIAAAGLFAGAVLGPLLLGQVVEHASFDAAWAACGALALLAGLAVLAGRRVAGARGPASIETPQT